MGELISRQCPVCGSSYSADLTRLSFGRQTTCSRRCSYSLRGNKLAKTRRFSCVVCMKDVLRSPAQVKSSFVFCSPKCHYKGRSLGYVQRIVTEPYTVTDSGKQAWRDSAEKRRGVLRKDPTKWTCEICGNERVLPRGQVAPSRRLRFCSPQCANKALRGVGNPSWRGGHPDYYGPDWRPLQRLARKLDSYLCQRCDVPQEELGRALDVHHIKPVSSFVSANDANYIENLVSLCHDCHMLIEWNGIDFELPIRCWCSSDLEVSKCTVQHHHPPDPGLKDFHVAED
jgi:5-methylcytosine-specific restriction endonuclease McrA